MARLVEVLVVEKQLKAQAAQVRGDLRKTFETKRHLFESKIKSFTPKGEGEPLVEEQSDIQSSVAFELSVFAGVISKAIDASYAVAEGNTDARADVVLDDGSPLLSQVPTTALLELEKRAAEVQELLQAVPTLDPAKGFSLDASHAVTGVHRARDARSTRSKKVEDYIVVVQATKEHPAQVAKVSKDVEVGEVLTQEWSALVTPARKAELLSRVEELRRSLKAALHRANAEQLVNTFAPSAKIFEYLFKN